MKNIFLLSFLLLLTGCATGEPKEVLTKADSLGLISMEDVTILEDSFLAEDVKVDLTGDGVEEEILLYVSPSPINEETGGFVWDDSHFWQLLVKDGTSTYPLFNDHLSGVMEFWIGEEDGENSLILINNGTGLTLYKFTYQEKGFNKEVIYTLDTITNRSVTDW
ncbi:hypothetical protein [Bacillus sp. FJAT-22090]|uniref:hypothetical protein n=1 Tax=Bacillus sp. FJAT-22090 TaxID=1581038 RepID=UPI0006ADC71D|nr:hypothetical protein [Bacillus sp. FJAT-22090]